MADIINICRSFWHRILSSWHLVISLARLFPHFYLVFQLSPPLPLILFALLFRFSFFLPCETWRIVKKVVATAETGESIGRSPKVMDAPFERTLTPHIKTKYVSYHRLYFFQPLGFWSSIPLQKNVQLIPLHCGCGPNLRLKKDGLTKLISFCGMDPVIPAFRFRLSQVFFFTVLLSYYSIYSIYLDLKRKKGNFYI